jgi:hypothetical protein
MTNTASDNDTREEIEDAERAGRAIEAGMAEMPVELGDVAEESDLRGEPSLSEEEEDQAFEDMSQDERWSNPRWWDRYGSIAVEFAMNGYYDGSSGE